MYRRLNAVKDTYITNKIIKDSFRATDANVGEAATLDLFKLYNENNISGEDEPVELTRILIKFDLNPLRALTGSTLDYTSDSFRCDLKLYDVFGGQTLPSNFKVLAAPLSQSFDEGVGRDVFKFQDIDAANFITASNSGGSSNTWFVSGANRLGLLGSDEIDVIASGNLNDGNGVVFLYGEQTFTEGTEDLSIDVTSIISGTLASQIPDYGFRISFSGTQETDDVTRFVKRFASRHNSNTRKRPRLEVRYNDTIQDHHESFFFNLSGSVFLNNFERGQPGAFEKVVSASQHKYGTSLSATGIYSATFAINSFGSSSLGGSVNNTLEQHIRDSGSVTFRTNWESADTGSVGYHTGSLTVNALNSTAFQNQATRFILNITNLKDSYRQGQKVRLRCVAFNDDEVVKAVKTPLYRTSQILVKSFYRIRDTYSDEVVIPFDETFNATLMSTDSDGMYFDIFTDDLELGRVFTIDVKVKDGGVDQIFKNVGGNFRIES